MYRPRLQRCACLPCAKRSVCPSLRPRSYFCRNPRPRSHRSRAFPALLRAPPSTHTLTDSVVVSQRLLTASRTACPVVRSPSSPSLPVVQGARPPRARLCPSGFCHDRRTPLTESSRAFLRAFVGFLVYRWRSGGYQRVRRRPKSCEHLLETTSQSGSTALATPFDSVQSDRGTRRFDARIDTESTKSTTLFRSVTTPQPRYRR